MSNDSLARFTAAVRADWGALSTSLVARCRQHLAELTLAEPHQPWLAALLAERPPSRELLRDDDTGVMLLAHTETGGLYRPPHDHGRSWVVYAVQSGELEVGTYGRVDREEGGVRLVRRDMHVLRPGEARAYLPGDIHDTRCLSGSALLFRFTERDLRHEDQIEHRVTRFVMEEGQWIAPS